MRTDAESPTFSSPAESDRAGNLHRASWSVSNSGTLVSPKLPPLFSLSGPSSSSPLQLSPRASFSSHLLASAPPCQSVSATSGFCQDANLVSPLTQPQAQGGSIPSSVGSPVFLTPAGFLYPSNPPSHSSSMPPVEDTPGSVKLKGHVAPVTDSPANIGASPIISSAEIASPRVITPPDALPQLAQNSSKRISPTREQLQISPKRSKLVVAKQSSSSPSTPLPANLCSANFESVQVSPVSDLEGIAAAHAGSPKAETVSLETVINVSPQSPVSSIRPTPASPLLVPFN